MCKVRGRENLITAADLIVSREPAPAPLSYGSVAPGKLWDNHSPKGWDSTMEIQVSRGDVLALCWSKRNLDTLVWVAGTLWLHPCQPFPEGAKLRAERGHLYWESSLGERKGCPWTASWARRCQRGSFLFPYLEYWIISYMARKQEEAVKAADRTLWRH